MEADENRMRVHLVNPSDSSFGTAVITPRWLYVLAGATPESFGAPVICDETLRALNPEAVHAGDVVGIGIHTGNALRGYAVGKLARARGAHVVFGGIHATLYPDEAFDRGGAHAVVKGDGDVAWGQALNDFSAGSSKRVYEGGRVDASQFKAARWDLLPQAGYLWASVQTVRGPGRCWSADRGHRDRRSTRAFRRASSARTAAHAPFTAGGSRRPGGPLSPRGGHLEQGRRSGVRLGEAGA